MREYKTPDFDVTIYEIEDVITVSGEPTLDENSGQGNTGWWN